MIAGICFVFIFYYNLIMTFLKFDPMRHFDDIASKFETALNQACDELMEKGFVKAEDIKKRIPLRKL